MNDYDCDPNVSPDDFVGWAYEKNGLVVFMPGMKRHEAYRLFAEEHPAWCRPYAIRNGRKVVLV